jgi:hypothetical protein
MVVSAGTPALKRGGIPRTLCRNPTQKKQAVGIQGMLWAKLLAARSAAQPIKRRCGVRPHPITLVLITMRRRGGVLCRMWLVRDFVAVVATTERGSGLRSSAVLKAGACCGAAALLGAAVTWLGRLRALIELACQPAALCACGAPHAQCCMHAQCQMCLTHHYASSICH